MANEMRDRLVESMAKRFKELYKDGDWNFNEMLVGVADRLLDDGWIRPPCKVGDTVYEVIAYKNKANGNRIDGHIRPCVVKSIHLSDAHSKKDEPYITLGAGGSYLHGAYIKRVSIDEFGKSIFPSEDQAEQKLKEMRGE